MVKPSRQKIEAICICGNNRLVRQDTYNANIKRNNTYICHHCATIKAGFEGKYSHTFETRSQQSKKMWLGQEFRDAVTAGCIVANTTEEYRSFQSSRTIRLWNNKEYHNAVSDGVHKALKDPIVKSRISNGVLNAYATISTYKARLSQSISRILDSDEIRAQLSTNTKTYWENNRDKLMTIFSSPAFAKRASSISKELWTDEKYRQKVVDGVIKKWTDEEYRAKMAIARSQTPRISSLQITLYKLLDDLGVTYEKEGPATTIGYFCFDCLIKTSNQKTILLECQGDYWHSSSPVMARDKGKFTYIDRYFPDHEIMYLWEHEFYTKDRVLDRLKLKLQLSIDTMDFNFRDIDVRIVDSSDTKQFLNSYHYIGKGRGGIVFGAYLNNELIACVVYSPPLRQNTAGQFGLKDSEIRELSRFCIHPSYHKKNFASWLIAKTISKVRSKFIIAYSDKTVGHFGTIYQASNFILHHTVPADYWYIDAEGYVIHKRTLYGKASQMRMTESEYAVQFGYFKKYGGEKLCYILKINGESKS